MTSDLSYRRPCLQANTNRGNICFLSWKWTKKQKLRQHSVRTTSGFHWATEAWFILLTLRERRTEPHVHLHKIPEAPQCFNYCKLKPNGLKLKHSQLQCSANTSANVFTCTLTLMFKINELQFQKHSVIGGLAPKVQKPNYFFHLFWCLLTTNKSTYQQFKARKEHQPVPRLPLKEINIYNKKFFRLIVDWRREIKNILFPDGRLPAKPNSNIPSNQLKTGKSHLINSVLQIQVT